MSLFDVRVPVSGLLIVFITIWTGVWSKVQVNPLNMSSENRFTARTEELFATNVTFFRETIA